MKKLFLTILMCLAAGIPTGQRISAQVVVRIGVEKTRYIVGEAICLEETLVSRASQTMNVPHLTGFGERHDLQLLDARGQQVPSYFPITGSAKGRPLAPGEQVTHVRSLDWWGTETIPFGAGRGLAPGSYRLSIQVDGAKSNTIAFEVVVPDGEEKEVFRSAVQARGLKEGQAEYSAFRRVLEAKPKTVYASGLYAALNSLESVNPRGEQINWWLLYCQRFPDSWYASIAGKLYVRRVFHRFMPGTRKAVPVRGAADTAFVRLKGEERKLRGTRAGAAIEQTVREYRTYLTGQGY